MVDITRLRQNQTDKNLYKRGLPKRQPFVQNVSQANVKIMKSIDEIQKDIIREYNSFGGSFEQYEHLIKAAKEILPFTQEARKIASIVQGCQS